MLSKFFYHNWHTVLLTIQTKHTNCLVQEREITKRGEINPALLTGAAARSSAVPTSFSANPEVLGRFSSNVPHNHKYPFQSQIQLFLREDIVEWSEFWFLSGQNKGAVALFGPKSWICTWSMRPSYDFRRDKGFSLSLGCQGCPKGSRKKYPIAVRLW